MERLKTSGELPADVLPARLVAETGLRARIREWPSTPITSLIRRWLVPFGSRMSISGLAARFRELGAS